MRWQAQHCAVVFGVLAITQGTMADIIVDYTIDAGGSNTFGIEGLSARSTWSIDQDQLTILIENTSTSVADGFEISDSLLVSLAFNLPDTMIKLGNSAVIGAGSVGLGKWSDLGTGDSVAEEWMWTNNFGGDLLKDYAQVISTSMGARGSNIIDFNGNRASVSGPFGGVSADPTLLSLPDSKWAVSNSILFSITLSGTLDESQLLDIARASVVEFGSDFQYLAVPTPGALGLLVTALVVGKRRRRRTAEC